MQLPNLPDLRFWATLTVLTILSMVIDVALVGFFNVSRSTIASVLTVKRTAEKPLRPLLFMFLVVLFFMMSFFGFELIREELRKASDGL